MDGMPLTLDQINTFIKIPKKDLEVLLEDLTEKNYLRFEHPKKLVKKKSENKQGDFPLGEAFGMILAAVCAVIGTTFVWRFKSGGDVE